MVFIFFYFIENLILLINLFEIKNGPKIRLANIDAPSKSDPNKKLASFAITIQKYAESQFLGQTLTVEFIHSHQNKSEPVPVHLFQKFPLKSVCYNKSYLERGYGKFVDEIDKSSRDLL